jgi:hypothetical protein
MTIPIFPISLLQEDDVELLDLLEATPDAWLFLGEVMAAALPFLATEGLVPAKGASATSVVSPLLDGRCVALELPLCEQGGGHEGVSLVFRAGIYLGLEDNIYWTHTLMMWACRPDEMELAWPPDGLDDSALRLAGKLQLRRTLAGRERLAIANLELREEVTRFGSTLESLCDEFCYRMSNSIRP